MSAPKRQKLCSKEEPCSDVPREVGDTFENNRLKAEIKQQVRKTPVLSASISTSWFKALKPEFSKEYFTKVCFIFIYAHV